MKSYGLDLQHSDINARASEILSGPSFPQTAQVNSVFYLTVPDATHPVGHYFYTDYGWKAYGDILSVTAGTGLKGGGVQGDVALALDTDFVVLDTDPRLYDVNRVTVRKNPGKGQFASVATALASITDNSITKTYLVDVGPGVFDEPQIVAKPFVFIHGAGAGGTILRALTPTKHFIIGSPRSAISDFTITGANGIGADGEGVAGVYYSNATGDTNLAFLVEHIKFGENHTHVLCSSGNVLVSSCTYGSIFPFVRGFVVKDDGVHQARIGMRSCSSSGMAVPYPTMLFAAIGPGSQILSAGGVARASASTDTSSFVGTGLYLSNGGRCRFLATSLVGFAKGIWAENAGAAPYMSCTGINLEGNTADLVIDHPGATGAFTGNAARSKSTINTSATVSILYTDTEKPGTVGVGPLYLGSAHNKVTDVSPLITHGLPNGLLSGGDLTRLGGLQIQVSAGVGYVKNGDDLVKLSWPTTALTVPANAGTQYVYVGMDGTIRLSPATPDTLSNIICGRILASATAIVFIGALGSTKIGTFTTNIEKLHQQAIGPVFVSGSIVTPCMTVVRGLDVSSGHYFYGTDERFPNAQMTANFLIGYHTGGAKTFQMLNQVPNTSYDNGTNLVGLTAGYFTKHVLYTNGDGANAGFAVAYGTGNYATLAEARSAPLPTPIDNSDGSPTIAAIIMQQGMDSIVEIVDLRPRIGFNAPSTTAVSRHGDLLGLGADDHQQYLRVDGTRAMVGNLDMGTHALNNVTTVNGVNFTLHADRHAPNGVDPLTTAAPTTAVSPSSVNGKGTANSFARSDHTHVLTGVQAASSELTAVAALTATGIVRHTAANTWTTAPVNLASTDVTGRLPVANIGDGTTTPSASNFLAGDGTWKPMSGGLAAFYSGKVAQGSSTSVIAYDTSTPLSTEGTLLWTKTVTPGSAASLFEVSVTGQLDVSSNSMRVITVAVFRGTTCIGTLPVTVETGWTGVIALNVVDAPATTASVTYSCRAGVSASGITWYIGRGTTATLGGTSNVVWTIKEIQ